jgi:hypothetical protein
MYQRPLPIPNEDTKPFWEGCKQHRLLLQQCLDCHKYRFPPCLTCPYCLSVNSRWVESSGKGSIYSFTVIHQVYGPGWADAVPYIVALIDLQEGVRMVSNIVDCQPTQVTIGANVEVTFADVTPDFSLPQFKIVS